MRFKIKQPPHPPKKSGRELIINCVCASSPFLKKIISTNEWWGVFLEWCIGYRSLCNKWPPNLVAYQQFLLSHSVCGPGNALLTTRDSNRDVSCAIVFSKPDQVDFTPHSLTGCWQDSVPCRLVDWESVSHKLLARGLLHFLALGLSIGQLTCGIWHNQVREQERESITSEATCYPFFQISLLRGIVTTSGPHSSGDGDTSKLMPGGEITGTHVRRYLPHVMTGFHFDGDKM